MADYHFVYKDVEGASTQWDDFQRKVGNLPSKPPPFKPPPFTPAEDDDSKPKGKGWIDGKTEEELEDLEDDLDDDRFLEEYMWRFYSEVCSIKIRHYSLMTELLRLNPKNHLCVQFVEGKGLKRWLHNVMCDNQFLMNVSFECDRKKRLVEMREEAKVAKFGSVIQISGSDFVREVSQAPQDVWVVVLLHKDGFPECRLLLQCLEDLAKRYPATKFVKIISTECIPNYPDLNLPTILVYNNSVVKATHVGRHSFGRRCTPESVALVLCQLDLVLNDGHSGEQSRDEVLAGVRKKFLERVVREHKDKDDGSSSD